MLSMMYGDEAHLNALIELLGAQSCGSVTLA